jgi:hypothetical protein
MSRSTVYVVIIVIAALAAGGAYHYLKPAPSNAAVPAPSPPAEAVTPAPTPPRSTADHGNFQKRFQPALPPSGGNGK